MKTETQRDLDFVTDFKKKVKNGEELFSKATYQPKNAIESVKMNICRKFVDFRNADIVNRKVKTLAYMVGVTAPQMSAILGYRIEQFTIDFLVGKLERLAQHDEQAQRSLNRLLGSV